MVAGESGLQLAETQREEKIAALKHWVFQQLTRLEVQGFDLQGSDWQALGGDAGFRRYFRFFSIDRKRTLMAVWAPPETEKNRQFVEYTRLFREHGLASPEVLAFDESQGFLIQQDLGADLYLDHLNEQSAEQLYTQAIEALCQLQKIPLSAGNFPRFHQAELRREMNLFTEWFVHRLLDYPLSEAQQQLVERCFSLLEHSALEQPKVIVHRDYHSRNLVYRGEQAPGIIDFQDALVGPLSYDLVSLLRDCYIQWPEAKLSALQNLYLERAQRHKLFAAADAQKFPRWFDWMGLQRHIKVLGIFARLYLRDGKAAYLNDLPLVIHYVRSVAAGYTELREFAEWFDETLYPLIEKQFWMQQ